MAAQCLERPSGSKGKEIEKPQGLHKPMAGGVPNVLGQSIDSMERELCLAWGKVRDQQALILFDAGATIISYLKI